MILFVYKVLKRAPLPKDNRTHNSWLYIQRLLNTVEYGYKNVMESIEFSLLFFYYCIQHSFTKFPKKIKIHCSINLYFCGLLPQ